MADLIEEVQMPNGNSAFSPWSIKQRGTSPVTSSINSTKEEENEEIEGQKDTSVDVEDVEEEEEDEEEEELKMETEE